MTQEKVECDNATAKELENDACVLVKDLQDQEIKLHRAESQLKRLVRELRTKSDSTMFSMEEKDIALRELMDRNQAALELLAEMSIRHMEAAPIISQHLRVTILEKNIIKCLNFGEVLKFFFCNCRRKD